MADTTQKGFDYSDAVFTRIYEKDGSKYPVTFHDCFISGFGEPIEGAELPEDSGPEDEGLDFTECITVVAIHPRFGTIVLHMEPNTDTGGFNVKDDEGFNGEHLEAEYLQWLNDQIENRRA